MFNKALIWSSFVRGGSMVLVATVLSCIVIVWTLPVEAQNQPYRAPMQPKTLTPQKFKRGSVSKETQSRVIKRLNPTLSLKQHASLKANGRRMSKELLAALNKNREGRNIQNNVRRIVFTGMEKTAYITAPKDEETLVTQTMLAIDQGNRENLHEIANKIQRNASLKAQLREEISMLRDELAEWPNNDETRTLTYLKLVQQADGSYKMIEVTQTVTKSQVESLLEQMTMQLETISDMTQMDMLNLQDAMNKQAQLMQMMSNIMKMFHDTAKSIIQNLR